MSAGLPRGGRRRPGVNIESRLTEVDPVGPVI